MPTRDFEAVVELDAGRPDVVVVPHRRGDDGYFMLQLTPPGSNGEWDRPILANGDPVNLLILADTSASIDASQRATQATFIGSLLSALTPKDTFNLATCDVTTDWAFAKATAADGKNVSAARDDPSVAKCIEQQLRGWSFPPPGEQKQVQIPFVFVRQ